MSIVVTVTSDKTCQLDTKELYIINYRKPSGY